MLHGAYVYRRRREPANAHERRCDHERDHDIHDDRRPELHRHAALRSSTHSVHGMRRWRDRQCVPMRVDGEGANYSQPKSGTGARAGILPTCRRPLRRSRAALRASIRPPPAIPGGTSPAPTPTAKQSVPWAARQGQVMERSDALQTERGIDTETIRSAKQDRTGQSARLWIVRTERCWCVCAMRGVRAHSKPATHKTEQRLATATTWRRSECAEVRGSRASSGGSTTAKVRAATAAPA